VYQFNWHELGFLTQGCDVKKYSMGLPELDKKKLGFDS